MVERTITRTVPSGTLPFRLLAAALAATLLAALLAPAAAATSLRTYLVPAGVDLPAGVRVLGALPVADALIVSAPTAPPGAAAADEPVGFKALLPEPSEGEPVLDSGVASTRAPEVWDTTRGERTVVALVDTGVAPLPVLENAVAGEIDFTGTGGGDGYGHGTYLASLIAARGDLAPGVAPGTGVLSLKVGRDDGSSDLGTVMSALQWLYGPGRAVGIRIATLALGVDADSAAGELLDLAAMRLAADGVLLVTAAGNEGPGTLTSPATSPGTFSVGAVDDRGTADRGDDVPADFSGTGEDRVGVAQPDAVASGVGVVGWMHADAHIARNHRNALVGNGLIRGSGTSMSTALTAGVAALALSARPDLDGKALDEALRAAEGELDAPDTVAAVLEMPERPAPPPGLRADGPAAGPPAGAGAGNGRGNGPANAEAEAASIRWHSIRWHSIRWHAELVPAHGWQSIRWHSIRWHDQPWGADAWGQVRWGSIRWHSIRWHGTHWGDRDWSWAQWSSIRWHDALGWQGTQWEGENFRSVRWGSIRWHSIRWTTVRWAWLAG